MMATRKQIETGLDCLVMKVQAGGFMLKDINELHQTSLKLFNQGYNVLKYIDFYEQCVDCRRQMFKNSKYIKDTKGL